MKFEKKITIPLLSTVLILSGYTIHAVNKQQSDEMTEQILSKDFAVAKQALDENILLKNCELVRLSLKHQSLIIKRQAAEALAELEDRRSVPYLIEALENNQFLLRGGSETKILQSKLNKAIVLALEKLTGLDFATEDTVTDSDIKQIIQKSKHWWNSNKSNISR